jgi:hypothetical protein
MEVSISEGDCLDGLLAAILLRAADDILLGCVCVVADVCGRKLRKCEALQN